MEPTSQLQENFKQNRNQSATLWHQQTIMMIHDQKLSTETTPQTHSVQILARPLIDSQVPRSQSFGVISWWLNRKEKLDLKTKTKNKQDAKGYHCNNKVLPNPFYSSLMHFSTTTLVSAVLRCRLLKPSNMQALLIPGTGRLGNHFKSSLY